MFELARKAKFSKSAEQNFSTEVFQTFRTPRPVYELSDLKNQPIDGQFYAEGLIPVRVTKDTQFQIDKIIKTRVRKGIKEHLVRWTGYGTDFVSWILASSIKKI
jgi:hypothetical protein